MGQFFCTWWGSRGEMENTSWWGYGRNPLSAVPCSLALSSASDVAVPEIAGNLPHCRHLVTTSICRHDGQEEWELSHVSTHNTWNPCPHCGRTRISSPSTNSAKHMAHSANLPLTVASWVSFGSDWRIFFFSPLFAAGCVADARAPPAEPRRSQAQRATAMRPTTHIRAHSSAARITTKSDSTSTASGGSAADEFQLLRNLEERVITKSRKERDGEVVVSKCGCLYSLYIYIL